MRGALLVALALAACAGTEVSRIPLHVVEEHDEAVLVLFRAREEGLLPESVRLVHVDAHADLGTPDLLAGSIHRGEDESEARYGQRLETVLAPLAVDDVLVPAALLGLVREVVWVVPDWLDEPILDEKLEVGSVGGRGWRLAVAEHLDEVIHPDRRALRLRVRRIDDLETPDAPWVLGLDLDALACRNPHADHADRDATEEEATRVLESGVLLARGMGGGPSVIRRSTLVLAPGEAWPRRVDRIQDLATAAVRWVIGWRCLGEARRLPVHDPAPGEAEAALRRLVARLADAPPPALVVISRSAESGFVPAGRVAALERAAIDALREAWPGLTR
jgi:hypothetical protein